MTYRHRLTKQITLPSGVAVTISKLNAFNAPFLEKRVSDDPSDHGVRLTKFILTDKVGTIDGLKIVDGVPSDTDSEIGIHELEQDDIDFVVAEVLDFSGLSKRAEEARRTFPEAQANGNSRAPHSQDVSGDTSDAIVKAPDGRMAATT